MVCTHEVLCELSTVHSLPLSRSSNFQVKREAQQPRTRQRHLSCGEPPAPRIMMSGEVCSNWLLCVSRTVHLSPGVERAQIFKWSAKRNNRGASAPPEARSTSGATDHDERSWFAPMKFFVCRERPILFTFPKRDDPSAGILTFKGQVQGGDKKSVGDTMHHK